MMGLDGHSVITHDDRLLVRFQKSDIGMEEGWREKTEVAYENGEKKLVGWYNPQLKKAVKKREDLPESEREGYLPMYERTVDVGNRITIQWIS